MFFLVKYVVIDYESHNLWCFNADIDQLMQELKEASKKKWLIITNEVCDNECDMQKLVGDGPGVLIVTKVK